VTFICAIASVVVGDVVIVFLIDFVSALVPVLVGVIASVFVSVVIVVLVVDFVSAFVPVLVGVIFSAFVSVVIVVLVAVFVSSVVLSLGLSFVQSLALFLVLSSLFS